MAIIDRLDALFFDLDNTLYPASSPMTTEISRRITLYVQRILQVDYDEASTMRRQGFLQYGTTLKWLEKERDFTDIEDYLEAVHPEDVNNYLPEGGELGTMLDSIPLPKYVLTNSSIQHARRVLDHFGIRQKFLSIFDITYNNMMGKPHESSYTSALRESGHPADRVLFIDDVPSYLEGFAGLGGQCLLVDENLQHEASSFDSITTIYELPRFLNRAS